MIDISDEFHLNFLSFPISRRLIVNFMRFKRRQMIRIEEAASLEDFSDKTQGVMMNTAGRLGYSTRTTHRKSSPEII